MKGGKLIAEGGYGCVFHPGIDCNGKNFKTKKYVSKIQRYDLSAKDEIKIGKIIKDINGYGNHFAPIIKHCEIDIAKIKKTEKDTDNCSIIKKNKSKKFVLMKLPYINGDDFINYLVSQKNSIQIVNSIINSYNHLVRSCQMLVSKSIMHYDIKGSNILYDIDKQAPILIDFGLSCDMSKKKTDSFFKKIFYVFAPQYYVWPLEVHYLSYLFNINKNPNNEELKKISNLFVKNNKAIQKNFSPNFLKKYENKCFNQLVKYNQIEFKKRIIKIINYWETFDNYSIAIMYLKFLKYININGFIDNEFIIFFSKLLLQNINPNPEKRLNLIDTVHTFNTFLYKKNLNNIETFEELTNNVIKNRFNSNKEMINEKKNELYETKTMKILYKKSRK